MSRKFRDFRDKEYIVTFQLGSLERVRSSTFLNFRVLIQTTHGAMTPRASELVPELARLSASNSYLRHDYHVCAAITAQGEVLQSAVPLSRRTRLQTVALHRSKLITLLSSSCRKVSIIPNCVLQTQTYPSLSNSSGGLRAAFSESPCPLSSASLLSAFLPSFSSSAQPQS